LGSFIGLQNQLTGRNNAQRSGANKQETKQDDQFREITKMIFLRA
jgi:hypothetical protein